ncbi:MAG: class I SAM-dependent rRNA methyltransferase [Chloroflexota bacterium]
MTNAAKRYSRPQGAIVLKAGREKPLLNLHPWIFSGAIDQTEGDLQPGDAVFVLTHKRDFLGIAVWNPNSQITVRMMSWVDTLLDDEYWQTAIKQAVQRRAWLSLEPQTNGYRLINAESDGIPGLIVDRYDESLVFQALTMGIDVRRDQIIQALQSLDLFDGSKATSIIERSDVNVRKKEGLPQVSGHVWGESVKSPAFFLENNHLFQVDLLKGHKTGFYLDQRENRALLGLPSLVEGKRILNCFAYTGGFSVYAAAAGAKSVVSVDASVPALEIAEQNVERLGLNRNEDEFLAGNVFDVLRYYVEENEQFDVIILDPPKFAHSQKDIQKASRGYKDINFLAMHLLKPGGVLLTFSCSGLISTDLFQKIVMGAAVDAGKTATLLKTLSQASDHTVSLHFPEGHYLKGLMCEIF